MAGSANSAYMMWRQFSGDARPTAGQQRGRLNAVATQAPTNTGVPVDQAFNSAMNSLANFAQTYTGLKKEEETRTDEGVKKWMRTQTVEEYRKKVIEGNTPFQQDPLALAALQRNTGAALAFEVEEKVQNQIKQGAFKTTEEADKYRIEALNAARDSWIKDSNLQDPDLVKAFSAGFDIQQDDRRYLNQRLQQDVEDKNLRKQALIGVSTTLTAPMTPEAIAAGGPSFAADYMVRVLEQAQLTGQIRSPEEYTEALNHGLKNLEGIPGGADVLAELGKREVNIQGQKGTLRDFLGGGSFDSAVLQARDRENVQNSTRYGQFQKTILDLTRNGDLPGVDKLIALREAESGGKTTNEIESLYRARASILEAQDRENAKMASKVQKDNEEFGMLQQGMDGIRTFLQGGLVSKNFTDLGFKDAAQGRKGEELILNSIENPQERITTAIKLAGKFPEGFSANVLEEWKNTGKRQFEVYSTQLANGNENAVVPEMVQHMTAVYEQDPVAFGVAFGDQPYVDLHVAGKEVGMSLADMVKSKAKWDALPKDSKKEAEAALTKAVRSTKGGQESYVDKSLRVMATNLMAAGVSAPTAVETALDRFKQQHVTIDNAWVHKSFFTDNSKDASASQFAEKVFMDKVKPALMESLGNPVHTAIIYSPTDRSIWVSDTVRGKSIQYSREQMLEAAEKESATLREQELVKQEAAIKESAVDAGKTAARKRMADKRKENGMFPYNRPEVPIYGNPQETAKDSLEAFAQGGPKQRESARKVRDGSVK